MGTLVNIVDALVLLFLIVWIPSRIWKEHPQGFGSMLLSICVAFALIIFALASFIANGVYATGGLRQISSLIALAVMVILIRVAGNSKPTA